MEHLLDKTTDHSEGLVVDPLCPQSTPSERTIPIIEDDDTMGAYEFSANNDPSRFRPVLKYSWSVLALARDFVLDLTHVSNTSLVAKVARIALTVLLYVGVYTPCTGHLVYAMSYLKDHGWYLLAVTTAVVLLLGSGLVLAVYEWCWGWQQRCLSNSSSRSAYDRLRSVTVLDDDDMEDRLTLRGWLKRFGLGLVYCGVWSVYCALNATVDFWITDLYRHARPEYFSIELLLVNCLEAAPFLVGAATQWTVAYPGMFRFDRAPPAAREQPFSSLFHEEEFAGGGDGEYTITVHDDEVVFGNGMQNLIL